jgi:CRISPR-associated protein Cas2
MKADYLVCYDIADPKRLVRVYRFMKGQGVHLQYSVFQCALTWPEFQRLKEKLASLIDIKEDDIRIYPLPENSLVEAIGCGGRVPKGIDLFQ